MSHPLTLLTLSSYPGDNRYLHHFAPTTMPPNFPLMSRPSAQRSLPCAYPVQASTAFVCVQIYKTSTRRCTDPRSRPLPTLNHHLPIISSKRTFSPPPLPSRPHFFLVIWVTSRNPLVFVPFSSLPYKIGRAHV